VPTKKVVGTSRITPDVGREGRSGRLRYSEGRNGCTVTKEEHALLKRFNDEYGWERYRKAGLTVIDTQTGKRVI